MKRLVRVLFALVAGGTLLALQACTPEELAAVEQATGLELGSVEEVNAGLEQTFGPGSAEPGGAGWQVGADLISNANSQGEPSAPIAQSTNVSRWDRIAYCESGGNWAYPQVTNRTGTYSGGLMIRNDVWRHYGGQQYATYAYQASKAEQITVAERIWAEYGSGAWQCKA